MSGIAGSLLRKNGQFTSVLKALGGTGLSDDNTGTFQVAASVRLDDKSGLAGLLGYKSSLIKSLSDIDLISAAYQRWEEGCLRYLTGDFAFAIWNPVKKSLFCARDQLGIQPFYYSLNDEKFLFASNVKNLLHRLSDHALDLETVNLYLSGKNNSTGSFYKAISQLPAGHYVMVSADNFSIKKYWPPEDLTEISYPVLDDYVEDFKERINHAITDRLYGLSKVGAHATGGLDSSLISSLVSRATGSSSLPVPETYCWLPSNSESLPATHEYHLIDTFCDFNSTSMNYCPPKHEDIYDMLKQDVTQVPIDPSLHHELAIMARARQQGVEAIFTGFGGDEGISFNGRNYVQELLWRRDWKNLYREVTHISSHPVLRIMLMYVSMNFHVPTLSDLRFKRKGHGSSYINAEYKLSANHDAKLIKSRDWQQYLLFDSGHIQDRMESWGYFGSKFDIKYFSPLLDKRLVEFAIRLPANFFRYDGSNRWFMRKALNGLVPDEIILNTDKSEPVRVQYVKKCNYEVLERMGKQLNSMSELPGRAEYLDWNRLLSDLQPPALKARKGYGKILRALQFLDLSHLS